MGPLGIPPSNSPPGLREGRRRALHSQTTPTPPPEKTNNPKPQRQEEANVFYGEAFHKWGLSVAFNGSILAESRVKP